MALEIIHTISGLRSYLRQNRQASTVGFVPTMGNLHQGHIDLVDCARKKADLVVVSIFVNPMQFAVGEDLDSYPRTLNDDIRQLEAAQADVLFAPEVNEIYGTEPLEKRTCVIVPELANMYCGASRAGHFDGVTTVVNKLFNIVQPDFAVFGEKDFQQLTIIRRMVSDLDIPVEIIGVPTRREADGLAMSSRNGYLSTEERRIAPLLQQTLQDVKQQLVEQGSENYSEISKAAIRHLNQAGFRTDYLVICRRDDLQPVKPGDSSNSGLLVLAAVYLGTTRLIDNLALV